MYDTSMGAVYGHFENLHNKGATPHFTAQRLKEWLDAREPGWQDKYSSPEGSTGREQNAAMEVLLREAMGASNAAAYLAHIRPKCSICKAPLTDETMKIVLEYLRDHNDAELVNAGLKKDKSK